MEELELKIFEKINQIYKELRNFAHLNKIISRTELREKIKDLLQESPLTTEELNFFEEKYESSPLNYIFLGSIKEVPDSINAPSLIEQKNYRDITFYHGHTFATNDEIMEKAVRRVYIFKKEKMDKILNSFLVKSGFNVNFVSENQIIGIKNGVRINLLVFTSILFLENELKDLKLEENSVLVVPTGNTPGPYLNFYKLHANELLLNNIYVWIVDIENEAVSPFIGYIKDKDINSNFKSSQLARLASRILDMKIDEDF